MTTTHQWQISGSDGQPIFGNAHVPESGARGVLVICHGFKGYKDYGFFPRLARRAAQRGLIAHRFNFSHSGMTNATDTFERPDLFAKDTWGRQIFDLHQVSRAVREGALPGRNGSDLNISWFGHSRGGVTVLLAASRQSPYSINRIIAASAPHSACHLDEAQRALLRRQGDLESPSSRTGQRLLIGPDWLDELEADPDAFDPLRAIKAITCPILLIHGDADETVPVDAARLLHGATGGRARLEIVRNGTHTFNAPNPLPSDQPGPDQTRSMIESVVTFALE